MVNYMIYNKIINEGILIMVKILITGALGQIGSELIEPLINQYGEKNIGDFILNIE